MIFTYEQKELIEKHRDINTNFDWWDDIYERWTEKLIEKGIEPEEFRFTGFWSQGDGASFEGKLNLLQFLKAHNLTTEYPAATFFADDQLHACLFRGFNRYCHEHTIEISTTFDEYNDYAEDDLRHEVYNTMRDELNDETPDLEETLIDICRGYMRALYSDLRTEYEYLTSDEAVWETIVANDLHNEEVTY